ncbi:hypothetical protein POSPLADRAFT_1053201 [Postia placenta MAD-698-R-SB12]|uniref:Uncharacterized protein n=1 Tax=Postia placenta MAD-698-R-SB12 TaxID=670580 RepID=A0A1X6NDQ9_9APHY|nr:hypothetical protein POSPLADRAFT_1053201 [Postia placenta MAD-698-R-SB12]OSX66566.1 hypothetical protein POSPLADRAFT_1053201 [Postia placenta MAD-698-R-SB12]
MQGIPLARRHAAGHLLRLKSSNRLLPSATLKEPSRAFTDERNTSSSFNTVAVGAAGGVIILFGGGYAFYHFSGIKRVVDAYHGAKAYYQNKKAATSEKAQRFKERFIRSQSSTEPHSESVAMAKENGTLFSRIPRRGDAHEGATAGGVDEPKSQTASTDNVKEQRKKLRDLRKSGASGSSEEA